MKATIYIEGDPSVGIPEVTATFEDTTLVLDEHREDYRGRLEDAFGDFYGELITRVSFQDECPDCLTLTVEGKCPKC